MEPTETPDAPAAPAGSSQALAPSELMARHLPLVRILASKLYRLRWDDTLAFEDYYQMGAVGLAEAAQRYDPTRGAQFPTFASWRITGAILNGLEHSTERHQQASARKRLLQERAASFAERENAPQEAIEATFNRLAEAAVGLAVGFMLEDTGMYSDGSEVCARDGYAQMASRQLAGRLRAAVESLPASERKVVEGHYFQQMAFVEIAAQLNLTKGRISQIHRSAMEHLKITLREQMIGFDG
jgi:RNA polymerase sigma factor for flagellar operon FliA